jgi:CheY-like chemotaxis protein
MTGESILVVEDEGLFALHLTELLEKAGYRIIGPVYSGEKAVQKAGEPPVPDLVLMDIKLAGTMDGIETARLIRQRCQVPLIFLTAYASERNVERIGEVVAPEEYFTKPVAESDLLAAISRAIARRAEKKQ